MANEEEMVMGEGGCRARQKGELAEARSLRKTEQQTQQRRAAAKQKQQKRKERQCAGRVAAGYWPERQAAEPRGI